MAKANKLVDNFDDGILDPILWNTFLSGAGSTIVESGGVVTNTVAVSTVAEAQLFSNKYYEIDSSYISAKCTPAAGTTVDTAFKATNTAQTDSVYFKFSTTSIGAFKTVASVEIQIGSSISYDSINHAYLKIMESAGTFYFYTSPDGERWTLQWSQVLAIPQQDKLRVLFTVVEYAVDVAAGSATIDNWNIGQSALVSKKNIRPAIFTPGRAR